MCGAPDREAISVRFGADPVIVVACPCAPRPMTAFRGAALSYPTALRGALQSPTTESE